MLCVVLEQAPFIFLTPSKTQRSGKSGFGPNETAKGEKGPQEQLPFPGPPLLSSLHHCLLNQSFTVRVTPKGVLLHQTAVVLTAGYTRKATE